MGWVKGLLQVQSVIMNDEHNKHDPRRTMYTCLLSFIDSRFRTFWRPSIQIEINIGAYHGLIEIIRIRSIFMI